MEFDANKEVVINDFITMRLQGKRTMIYINGVPFQQCKRLVLTIPVHRIAETHEINSIDEAAARFQTKVEGHPNQVAGLTPEEEFWGHCSNMQAWVEHGYDTRLLHSNLAFPLLRKLVNAGDEGAREAYMEEIKSRLESGYQPTITFLVRGGYIQDLDEFEIERMIARMEDDKAAATILQQLIPLGIIPDLPPHREYLYSEIESLVLIKRPQRARLNRRGRKGLPDLKSLKKMKNLKTLKVHGFSGVNLNELCNLENLVFLEVRNADFARLPDFSRCNRLKTLTLQNVKLEKMPDLERCPFLTNLNLASNKISKVDIPERLNNLVSIDLSNNKIRDIASLGSSPVLQKVNLSNNMITDLHLLENFRSLRNVNVMNNLISSVKTLSNLPYSASVNFANNPLNVKFLEKFKEYQEREWDQKLGHLPEDRRLAHVRAWRMRNQTFTKVTLIKDFCRTEHLFDKQLARLLGMITRTSITNAARMLGVSRKAFLSGLVAAGDELEFYIQDDSIVSGPKPDPGQEPREIPMEERVKRLIQSGFQPGQPFTCKAIKEKLDIDAHDRGKTLQVSRILNGLSRSGMIHRLDGTKPIQYKKP